jgi:probable rRNA maturation factor
MSEKNKLTLSVQYADPRLQEEITRPMLRKWVKAALFAPAELTIRLVDAAEGQELNRDYRGKDYATNVLTFAYGDAEADDSGSSAAAGSVLADDTHAPPVSADLVLCAPVVEREARDAGKTLEAHYAHLLVHGTLHAQGHDHEREDEARAMEARESEILRGLGYADPYA